MRSVEFSGQRFGINRGRIKGGVSKDTLYDLQNAYINSELKFVRRPGLRRVAILEAGTKGLAAMSGQLHTFSKTFIAHANTLFHNNSLRHPSSNTHTVTAIHFAQPFLNRLYVVGEYSNGDVVHFWLQNEPAWQASTVYKFGQRVQPTVPNGYSYEVTSVDATAAWTANATHAVNDFVKPTAGDGKLKFKATAVTGSPARSGDAEPIWPTAEAATVTEYRSG